MTEYEVCQQNTMACEQEIAKGIEYRNKKLTSRMNMNERSNV